MSGKMNSVEVNGVFYRSAHCAGKHLNEDSKNLKRKCLSENYPNYKIVPFRITYTEKRCTKCGKFKPLKEFSSRKKNKDGLKPECRQCELDGGREYYKNNKEKRAKAISDWQKNNPEKVAAKKQRFLENHPDYYKKKGREWQAKARKDPIFSLNKSIKEGIRKSLKGMKAGRHWEGLVGYSLEDLIRHLESLFTEGMSWENYGKGKYKWCIDHIIPIKEWNITSTECRGFRGCWSLDNLQPLWWIRNIEKKDKPMESKYLIKPF